MYILYNIHFLMCDVMTDCVVWIKPLVHCVVGRSQLRCE